METETHIIYTLKWRKEDRPLMTEEYRRLKNQRNGMFLHKVCSVFEDYLEKQEAKDFKIRSSEFRRILQEEMQKLEMIPKKTRRTPQKKETEILQPQEQDELGQSLDTGW